jgi:hypothetical protein
MNHKKQAGYIADTRTQQDVPGYVLRIRGASLRVSYVGQNREPRPTGELVLERLGSRGFK